MSKITGKKKRSGRSPEATARLALAWYTVVAHRAGYALDDIAAAVNLTEERLREECYAWMEHRGFYDVPPNSFAATPKLGATARHLAALRSSGARPGRPPARPWNGTPSTFPWPLHGEELNTDIDAALAASGSAEASVRSWARDEVGGLLVSFLEIVRGKK